ncbi:MAG TPA: peroxidase-related enzyme [Candidatus Acidoferrum sp.]|nr:peroxidase-related enzyme [Candidatus Acidoferrum sp.]
MPFNEGAAHRAAPSRFGIPALDEMPDDIRAVCEESRAKLGFIPNVFLAYAQRPEHFRAFMQYHDLLMKGPSGLSRAEREAIVVAVSAENACLYCVTAHGAALRILGKDAIVADQVATNWRTADLSPRLRAILTFASHVNERGFAANEEEIAKLRAAGLAENDVWDIAAIAGFFGFSNKMAGLMDMRPNPQFYEMGRPGTAR